MTTFRDLVPPRRAVDDDDAWIARGNARRGETVEEALARGVKIHVVPPEWRSGEKFNGQWVSRDFKVIPTMENATPKPVRPPSPKRLARSSAKRVD